LEPPAYNSQTLQVLEFENSPPFLLITETEYKKNVVLVGRWNVYELKQGHFRHGWQRGLVRGVTGEWPKKKRTDSKEHK
jgi:hypothetical protein